MQNESKPEKRFDRLHLFLIVVIAVILTAIATFFLVRAYLFPAAFKPLELNTREERVLQAKLNRLDFTACPPPPSAARPGSPLEPEPYSEKDADRTIRFTEKELNALLAKNTDLADKVAIDLSGDLLSAKILIPLDEDFPVMGGKNLRVKAGLTFSYRNGRPVVILRGISLMGVPLPNAWLGNIKNVDVVKEFGGSEGFWKAFADGIDNVRIEEGLLAVTLKE